MNDIWIRQLLADQAHSSDEIERLRSITVHDRKYRAGQMILFEDDRFDMLYAITSGWIGNTRDLEDGTEQIIDVFLPGQLVGLRQLESPRARVAFRALTDSEVCLVDKRALKSVAATSPNLNTAIMQTIAREDAWLMERIATLGQRSAAECIMHFLLEVSDRQARINNVEFPNSRVELPINQEQLGNILAITPVHVSRVLKDLRAEGILDTSEDIWRFPSRENAELFCDYQARRL